MDIHQTKAYAHYLSSIGWIVENHYNSFAYIKKYPLLPISILKLQRIPLDQLDWNWIEKIEKKYHVVETVLELTTPSQRLPKGFNAASDFMLNTKTLVIDLLVGETELLKQMKPKTRYNLNLAERKGLTTKFWTARHIAQDNLLFDMVYEVLRSNAQRVGMWLIPKDWIRKQYMAFGNHGFVVGIYADSVLVSVATFYCSATTCSYNLNGSTATGRKLMAPTLAIWQGIIEAQRRKLGLFDFDGLYDPRYAKQQQRFKGYGRFKEGFGGRVVEYPPMYRRVRWPF